MEIEGTIVFDLPMQEGVSRAGKPWKKKEWVLEQQGMYPRKVKFTVFGETRVAEMNFEVGKAYRVSVDLESREFNGRWYTDVNAYAMQPLDVAAPAAGQFGAPAPAPAAAPQFGAPAAAPAAAADPFAGGSDNTDDLPF